MEQPHTDAPTVLDGATRAPQRPADDATLDPTGRSLGRYRVTGKLGEGGMGQVLAVRDEDLGRGVAAKVIRGEADARVLERFVVEAQITGQLQHPNIVPVHELGTDEEGRLYFTMKQVEGQDLAQLLSSRETPSLVELLQIFLKVCDCVAFAHSRGVIHRDLKPANIMVGQFGEVLVMDWGLASQVGSATTELQLGSGRFSATGSSSQTMDGTIVGTPNYMPPEQAAGRIGELDPRSDIYSLGAILYQMLTLEPPFRGVLLREVLAQVMLGKFEPPSKRAPGRRIPWELEAVVTQAMATQQAERYASAGELRADVERFLTGRTLEAAAYRPWQVLAKWIGRHRAACAAVGFVALVLVGLGIAWYLAPGQLKLKLSPAGARVKIGDRIWTASGATFEVALPAGIYRVETSAPQHHEQVLEAVPVERGKSRELLVALVHHTATLEATAEPPGSEIAVDGTAYGSRVRNLSLPTGEHRLLAWAEQHFERERRVPLLTRDTVRREYLWLDRGVLWTHTSASIQQAPIQLVPDMDGDGAPDLAHQTLLDLVVRSSRTGAELGRFPAASNSRWLLEQHDLGGSTGHVLLLVAEEPAGLHVTCLAPRAADRKLVVRWQWRGPRRSWRQPWHGALARAADVTGDGVRELAVAGRNGNLWILDGATGQALGGPRRIGVRPVARGLVPVDDGRAMAFVGLIGGDVVQHAGPAAAGRIELADGRLSWRATLGRVELAGGIDLRGRHALFSQSATRFVVRDPGSGRVLHQGAVPPAAIANLPHQPRDGRLPFSAQNEISMVELASGKRLWRRAGTLWIVGWGAGGELICNNRQTLTALDPQTGAVRWELHGMTGRAAPALTGDWDGDGRPETLIGMTGRGLVCVGADGRLRWLLRIKGRIGPSSLLPDIDGDGLAEVAILHGAAQVGVVRGPRILWKRRALSPLQATPRVVTIGGRPVVIQLGQWQDGALACFDGATGSWRWSASLDSTPNRAPTIGDWDGDGRSDVVLLARQGKQHGLLLAYRAADGTLLAEHRFSWSKDYTVPALADIDGDGRLDLVAHRYNAQEVLAVSGRTGKPLWRHRTRGPNMGAVAAADLDGDGKPDILAPSFDGSLYALRGRDGKPLWTAALGRGGSRSNVAAADLTGDGVPEALVVTQAGELRVFDGRDGRLLWQARGGEGFGRPRVVKLRGTGPVILAPLGAAGLVAVDWRSKRLLWRGPTGFHVTAAAVVADLDGDGRREVVVSANRIDEKQRKLAGGWLFVLDLRTGTPLWRVKLSRNMIEADPAVADLDGDGVQDVLIATHDGELIAVSGRGTAGARRRR